MPAFKNTVAKDQDGKVIRDENGLPKRVRVALSVGERQESEARRNAFASRKVAKQARRNLLDQSRQAVVDAQKDGTPEEADAAFIRYSRLKADIRSRPN